MSIDISMTGSGTIGEIQPGWTVNEYATPVTPGETSGGTGQVNVSASANDDTLFIVNNAITTTEQSLGSISGVVKAVNQTGIGASFSHNTQLSLFDANLSIPALGAGGVVPAGQRRAVAIRGGPGRGRSREPAPRWAVPARPLVPGCTSPARALSLSAVRTIPRSSR